MRKDPVYYLLWTLFFVFSALLTLVVSQQCWPRMAMEDRGSRMRSLIPYHGASSECSRPEAQFKIEPRAPENLCNYQEREVTGEVSAEYRTQVSDFSSWVGWGSGGIQA